MSRLHRTSSSGRTRALTAVAAGAVVVAATVAAFAIHLASKGGSGGTLPPGTAALKIVSVKAIPTDDAKGIAGPAGTAAQAAVEVLDRLYAEAFLDPSAWTAGDYSQAMAVFTKDAASRAAKDEAVLTLGPDAGSLFSSVANGAGTVQVFVLMTRSGHPSSVVADVSFRATAQAKAGGVSTIVSTGSYFLRQGGGGWMVYAYRVSRSDQGVATTPTKASG